MIGFIGLVAPHLVRLLLGPDHRWLLPGSAIMGAILVLGSDMVARTILAPAELPIGLVIAAFGGPFFLWLLLQRRNRVGW
jgi:iron complex transport system permease protein